MKNSKQLILLEEKPSCMNKHLAACMEFMENVFKNFLLQVMIYDLYFMIKF